MISHIFCSSKYVWIQDARNEYSCNNTYKNGLNVHNTLPVQQRNGWRKQQQQDTLIIIIICILLRFLGKIAVKPILKKICMQKNNSILPKIHGEVMQQTPPLASISHCTPAALTPLNQRQHHTGGGGGGEREWVGEKGSFISSHHPLPLLLLSVICFVHCPKN